MRPKIAILTLVIAIALVALAAVLKGRMGGPAGNDAQAPASTESNMEGTPPAVAAAVPMSSNAAAITAQLRSAETIKEVEQIQNLVTDPTAGPTAMGILVGKVTAQEPEVRKAAVEALVQLGDTNALPGMEQAVAAIEDPREKVALMDAIAYLKLPPTIPATPPGDLPEMGQPGSPSDPAMLEGVKAKYGKPRNARRAPRAQVPGQTGIPAIPPAQAQPQMPGSAPQ
jgi:hypothetical protein